MTKKITLVGLVAGFMFFLAVSPVNGAEPLVGTEKTLDPRAIGMGGALRASASTVSGIYLNPAVLSMARVYHINLKYQYTGRDELHNGGILFLDSVTSARFAAGLSLDYLRNNRTGTDFESWDGRLGLSTSFADKVFIGMTGRYVRAAHDRKSSSSGPNGEPALPSSGSIQANGFTFDAGAAARLGNMIGLGVVGYNLTNTGSIYAPIQLGMGVSISLMEMVLLETDLVLDFTSYDSVGQELDVGAEVFLAGQFAIRAGYIHDFHYGINRMCAGLGYSGQRFAIDFGYKQDIEYSKRFRLAFGFKFFIS